jgi:hypothetical protein
VAETRPLRHQPSALSLPRRLFVLTYGQPLRPVL